MLTEERRAYLELHIAVLLFGLTAILGDLIQLTALVLVWWRVLLTSGSLLPFVKVRQLYTDLGAGLFWRFAGIGVLVALHWVTFYGAIKLSNASICLVCMATTSFFTSFLEPLIVKRPFRWYELLLGILIIPGMALVVTNIRTDMMWGVVAGLASAFLAATFATFNKKYLAQHHPPRITFLELSSAWVFLSFVLGFLPMRCFFFFKVKVPNFVIFTFLCSIIFVKISSNTSSNKFSLIFFEKPICI